MKDVKQTWKSGPLAFMAQNGVAANLIMVVFILGGVFMAVNNAMLKWVSGYPPGEVLFLRGIFTVLSILVLVGFSGSFIFK